MRRNRPSFDLDGRIRQRRHAGDLAVEGAVKLEVARWIRLPRPRWGLIGRAPVRTAGVVEEAEAMRKRAGIDLALLRHIVDMLERRPDPLRPAHRLVDHMKSDQAKCLWQHGGRTFGSGCGSETSAFTVWNFRDRISSGLRIFHDTLIMMAPAPPSTCLSGLGFCPDGKSIASPDLICSRWPGLLKRCFSEM
jgi:hypothetical protein